MEEVKKDKAPARPMTDERMRVYNEKCKLFCMNLSVSRAEKELERLRVETAEVEDVLAILILQEQAADAKRSANKVERPLRLHERPLRLHDLTGM